jgi:uncharacterized membrane protein
MLSGLLLLPLLAFGKSYYYPEIKTELRLLSDGRASVAQERTYAFDGSFSWAELDLKKQGADQIVFNGLYEMKDGKSLQIQPLEVTDRGASLYIKWGYSAQNEQKTFRVTYTVNGALKRYQDVADFYWKVIEDQHERVARSQVTVFLPTPSPDLFKIYIHADAPPGKLTFSEEHEQAWIDQAGIPGNAFQEVRVLTAPGIFPQVSLQPIARYQQILNEEKSNYLTSSLRKYVLIPLGIVLMVILPLILLIVLYVRFGREPKLSYDATYEHEPPRMAPPVSLPAILNQRLDSTEVYKHTFQGMFATLLDLARRGFVSIHETKEGHRRKYEFRLDKPDRVSQLDPFGRDVVKFFFEEVAAEPNVLTDKALEKYMANQNRATGIRAMLSDFYDRAKKWWATELSAPLLDPASNRAYLTFCGLTIVLLGLGWLALSNGLKGVFGGQGGIAQAVPAALGAIVFLIFLFAGRTILRWTEAAYLEHKRWLAFKKFLKDFSAIEKAPVQLLAIWEQYYVYAAALGVAHEFLKNITRLSEKQGMPLVLPIWYMAAAGSGPGNLASLGDGLAGFESFATNMTSMMSSFSTATSSGGGFSGGGGGGGGGGSSGAG